MPSPAKKPSSYKQLLSLTPVQQDIWLDCQLTPHLSQYNIGGYIVIHGQLDEAVFSQCLNKLVQRHDALRLELVAGEGVPLQRILSSVEFELPIVDFSKSENPEKAARSWMAEDMQRPFNLLHSPLWRFEILRLSDSKYCWYYAFHHLISDGVSLHLLPASLSEIHQAYIGKGEVDESPIFSNCVNTINEYQESDQYRRDGLFWENEYKTIPPSVFSSNCQSIDQGETVSFCLNRERTKKLNSMASSLGASTFHVIQTLLFLYFSRVGKTNDLAIGIATHNRRNGKEHQTLGVFSQIIPLRVDFEKDLTFLEAMQLTSTKLKRCYKYSRFPQGEVNRRLGLHKMSRKRVFDVELSYIPSDYGDNIIGNSATPFMFISNNQEQTPLRIYCFDDSRGGVLRFYFNHNLGYLSPLETVQIVERFNYLLEQVVIDPSCLLSQYLLVPPNELRQLCEWGSGEIIPTSSRTFMQIFEDRVDHSSQAVALSFEQQKFTYSELNRKVNRLAHRLINLGVEPGVLVGLYIERSPELMIGLLAVLKAGAAYVPMDVSSPEARVLYMLEDSGAKFLLTQDTLMGALPNMAGVKKLNIHRELDNSPNIESNPIKAIGLDSLAYVIYTSGSTGKPKGVMVEHFSLINFLIGLPKILDFSPADKFFALTNISFDISIVEILMPLINGGEVILTSPSILKDPALLIENIQMTCPTHIQATPASWRGIYEGLFNQRFKAVISGGESISEELAVALASMAPISLNLYGPTETTIWSSGRVLQNEMSYRSIGSPLPNESTYVLDEHEQLLPIGVPGELYIGGVGLARGYLNRPELTKERFVEVELLGEKKVLYRTGDLVSWNSKGELEFLGRLDHQIKLHGYRIELGEIESALREHSQVADALVVAKGEGDNRGLIGYVVPHQESDTFSSQPYIRHWHALWDSQYQESRPESLPQSDFDITGWKSSYSGDFIPEVEMLAWVDETVERIRRLGGNRVLEIGCGTGLLLSRLAANKARYIGLDFSEAVLENLDKWRREEAGLDHVELHLGQANDLTFLEDNSIDLVILNSVIQYFPNMNYLLEVINQLCRVCSPNASIFMGDIRNFNLLDVFHSSVAVHKSDNNALVEWVSNRSFDAVFKEEELLLAPEFFYELADRQPGIARAEIQLKSGHYDNELSRFRYDACLVLGAKQQFDQSGSRIGWDQAGVWRKVVFDMLKRQPTQSCIVTGVPDRRISTAIQYRDGLNDKKLGLNPLKDLNEMVVPNGTNPTELYELADLVGVDLIWKGLKEEGCYDVVFNPQWAVVEGAKEQETKPEYYYGYSNNPAQQEAKKALGVILKDSLSTMIPNYMIPSDILVLDRFPLTPNGKIDRASLPEPGRVERLTHEYVAPRSVLEQSLVDIWKDVLMLSEAPGVTDDFFDLGGQSLLSAKVISRIEREIGKKVSLKQFFQQPTIESIAASLQHKEVPSEDGESVNSFCWSLPDKLHHDLESYIGGWEGNRISDEGLIVGRNTSGKNIPLFWVFQGERELHQMATYLGSEQPLYGMRSGHLITEYSENDIQHLALRYVEEIELISTNGPIFIGGNCQAGMIALAISQHLQRRQKLVPLTFLMEWVFGERLGAQPYLGPVAFLYGKDSELNPYISYRQPELYWKRAFPDFRVKIIPGMHGQFFQEPNIQGLTNTVASCMREALKTEPLFIPLSERRAELRVTDVPEKAYVGSQIMITVEVYNRSSIVWRRSEDSGLIIANRWLDSNGSLVKRLDACSSLPLLKPGQSSLINLLVNVPDEHGEFVLYITLVEEGICWFSGKESGELFINLNVIAQPY